MARNGVSTAATLGRSSPERASAPSITRGERTNRQRCWAREVRFARYRTFRLDATKDVENDVPAYLVESRT